MLIAAQYVTDVWTITDDPFTSYRIFLLSKLYCGLNLDFFYAFQHDSLHRLTKLSYCSTGEKYFVLKSKTVHSPPFIFLNEWESVLAEIF